MTFTWTRCGCQTAGKYGCPSSRAGKLCNNRELLQQCLPELISRARIAFSDLRYQFHSAKRVNDNALPRFVCLKTRISVCAELRSRFMRACKQLTKANHGWVTCWGSYCVRLTSVNNAFKQVFPLVAKRWKIDSSENNL